MTNKEILAKRLQEISMTNISVNTTGISGVIMHVFFDTGTVKHGCRVKVSNYQGKYRDEDTFSIDLKGKIQEGVCKLTTKQLRDVRFWISLNKDVLKTYWDSQGAMPFDVVSNEFKKIPTGNKK